MKKTLGKEIFLAFSVFCAAVVLVGYTGTAHAQAINYGALEDVFQEPVTTSATGTPQRASEVAADMTIITADQIRQSGSRAIPEIIGMYTPGVNILQEGIDSYDIGIRGYQQAYNPRLLVLIDGRQVFSDDYSRTPWDNLPVNVDDIRQIEIVKGASSALFGSNATGGVINIITYNPLYDNNDVVSLNVGTQHGVMADGTVVGKLGNYNGLKISAGGLDESPFNGSGPFDIRPTKDLSHRYVVASDVFKASSSLIFNGEITYSQKYDSETIPINFNIPVTTESFSGRAGFAWNTPIGQIKNDNYINHNSLSYDYEGTVVPQNSLVVSRLEDLVDVGSSNTIRLMMEYRHKYSEVGDQDPYVYQKPVLNEDVYTLGGTWLSHITDRLSWTNAIRYDVNTMHLGGVLEPTTIFPFGAYNQKYSTISGNSGLAYNVTDEDTIRLTFGRGVQDPSLVNTGYDVSHLDFGGFPGQVTELQGNPNLRPVVVQNYELGYDRKLPDIYSTARMGIYYETNRSIIGILGTGYFDGTNAHTILLEENVGDSQGFGGELDINGSAPNGLRWDASYSYQYVHDDSEDARDVLNYNGSAPHHQFRLSLGYTTGDWEFDIHNQFVTSTNMYYYPLVASPVNDYYTMTGRIAYKVTDYLTASLYGSNLTAAQTTENPYGGIERRIFLGLTSKF